MHYIQNSLIAILFFILPSPVNRFLIDCIGSNLPELSRLETICGKSSPEATSGIKSDSISPHSESLRCPVTIDDELLSSIALIPWSTIDESYESSELCRGIQTKIRMQSRMYQDEVFSFSDSRKALKPLDMSVSIENFSEFSGFFMLIEGPIFLSYTHDILSH